MFAQAVSGSASSHTGWRQMLPDGKNWVWVSECGNVKNKWVVANEVQQHYNQQLQELRHADAAAAPASAPAAAPAETVMGDSNSARTTGSVHKPSPPRASGVTHQGTGWESSNVENARETSNIAEGRGKQCVSPAVLIRVL